MFLYDYGVVLVIFGSDYWFYGGVVVVDLYSFVCCFVW